MPHECKKWSTKCGCPVHSIATAFLYIGINIGNVMCIKMSHWILVAITGFQCDYLTQI